MTHSRAFLFRRFLRVSLRRLGSAFVKMGRILLPVIFVTVALPVFWFIIAYFGPDYFWGITGGGMIAFFGILAIHHYGFRVPLADPYSSLSRFRSLVHQRLNRLRKPRQYKYDIPTQQVCLAPLSLSQSMLDHDLDDLAAQVSWEDTLHRGENKDEPYTDEDFGLKKIDGCVVDTFTGEVVSFPANENTSFHAADLEASKTDQPCPDCHDTEDRQVLIYIGKEVIKDLESIAIKSGFIHWHDGIYVHPTEIDKYRARDNQPKTHHEPFESANRNHDQQLQEYLHPEDHQLDPDPYYFYRTDCEQQLHLDIPDPEHHKPIAVVYIP